ncbi:hypothetical protein BDP27DRAFT_1481768, partial [Rhodocollybia butyracea]
MKALRFCWVCNHVAQYVDGHEHTDVVQYCQEVFLPSWYRMEAKTWSWTSDNVEEVGHRTVFWFHDEPMFYAHDRCKAQWVADGEPYAKGEGISLMVADL